MRRHPSARIFSLVGAVLLPCTGRDDLALSVQNVSTLDGFIHIPQAAVVGVAGNFLSVYKNQLPQIAQQQEKA
jgi:hypothetical protein